MSKVSPGILAPPHEVFTPDEWRAKGRERRSSVSRSSHAQWAPPADRPDPVAVLEEQARTRVPDLIPIRYGRMIASPFSYFRGAAAPMAWDLAHTPTTDIRVQACGDAHLLNFGMYAAPDRQLVFDVNDFDETLPAPFEWDVKRLAASFAVAARDHGYKDRDAHTAARLTVRSYRTRMARYAAMRFFDVWYSRIDIDEVSRLFDVLQPKAAVRRRHRDIAQARRRTSQRAFLKMCDEVQGQYRIRPAYPVIIRFPVERYPGVVDELRSAIAQYRQTLEADRREVLRRHYFGDFARKVVGVGSVGTEAFVVLLIGDRADEPLFLQIKEAQASVLSPYLGASRYANQGERVVAGQRLMQAASDTFLGWQRTTGLDGEYRDFYVRQLRDWKFSFPIEAMVPEGLRMYAAVCGGTLARAHSRSGDRIAIASYLGNSDVFDNAIADFASAYADQNERDYNALGEAAASGRVTAERGV